MPNHQLQHSTNLNMNQFIVICLASLIAVASARSFDFTELDELINADRIINGTDAILGQFPYHVSLRANNTPTSHFCGGAILNSFWILTGGHCTEFVNGTPIAVAGTIKLSDEGQQYDIVKMIAHPGYVLGKVPYDIALWKTSKAISFNNNVRPATLPTEDTPANVVLTVPGFGRNVVSIAAKVNEHAKAVLSISQT